MIDLHEERLKQQKKHIDRDLMFFIGVGLLEFAAGYLKWRHMKDTQ